ncbi:mismatch-specific DNA-glycosylase [Pseudalkalibacillus hwajinpoensis]|uniref:mismatch-specific DNA-glycosylase n=1 Tax=Guptibacillus hwajinpoensis TaxID=208199 RepID=UPI001CD1A472|nr:mismatch-specific DNA-glycosylase [Pseudalkalibacillus hwajinpoensis]MCA0990470.1 mismatch-specific DNA-glycosylase [Pseudalkalibacillus hwajinpoensis]
MLPDHLDYNLKILFIGFNPGLQSEEVGHHYANPTNRFFAVLYEAGLTDRKLSPEEDHRLLEYGYGLTNIVDRPTRGASDLTIEDYVQGRKNLMKKINGYMPLVNCYVGKGVYQKLSGIKKVDWGFQPINQVDGVRDFVAPSTSGLVRMSLKELIGIYSELKVDKVN